MTSRDEKIRELLGEQEEASDTSLRGNALRRATQDKVPTTLTPHEWEQWYAQHGVPANHRPTRENQKKRWWRWWRWW